MKAAIMNDPIIAVLNMVSQFVTGAAVGVLIALVIAGLVYLKIRAENGPRSR